MTEPKELQYIPAPEKPKDFDKQWNKIVSKCPTGEPLIRFRWAMDIKETLNGVDFYRYPDIYNNPPKYVAMPFFILEGWQDSDVYDREEWQQNKDVLGEFPKYGVWDFIEVLRGENHEPIGLGERALGMAREWSFWRSKPRKRAIKHLIEQRERTREQAQSKATAVSQKIKENARLDYIRALERGNVNPVFSLPSPKNYQHSKGGILIPE